MAEGQEALNYDVKSNEQGGWNVDIEQTLAPGPHVVTVEDNAGNRDEVIMYVVGNEESFAQTGSGGLVQSLAQTVPNYFIYPLLILFALIIALIINNIRLARKADQGQEVTAKKHYTRWALIFCLIVLLITLATGIFLNRQANFLNVFFNKELATKAVIKLSGQIVDPLTGQGVGGVDLTSGETSIHTSGSGQYIFGSVLTVAGLKATHPELLKGIVLLPPGRDFEEKIDWQFNVSMFNTLIRAIDYESRGNLAQVYQLLPDQVKEKLSEEDFIKNIKSIYSPENVTDQEVRINSTKLLDRFEVKVAGVAFDKVVEIEVSASSQKAVYRLVNQNSNWYLLP